MRLPVCVFKNDHQHVARAAFCPPSLRSLAVFHLTDTTPFSLLVNCISFPFSRKREREVKLGGDGEMTEFVCLLKFLSLMMMQVDM